MKQTSIRARIMAARRMTGLPQVVRTALDDCVMELDRQTALLEATQQVLTDTQIHAASMEDALRRSEVVSKRVPELEKQLGLLKEERIPVTTVPGSAYSVSRLVEDAQAILTESGVSLEAVRALCGKELADTVMRRTIVEKLRFLGHDASLIANYLHVEEHQIRWLTTGRPKVLTRFDSVCRVEGCFCSACTRGLCRHHYFHAWKRDRFAQRE